MAPLLPARDKSQGWPPGWWLLPAILCGAGFWVVIFRLVARLF